MPRLAFRAESANPAPRAHPRAPRRAGGAEPVCAPVRALATLGVCVGTAAACARLPRYWEGLGAPRVSPNVGRAARPLTPRGTCARRASPACPRGGPWRHGANALLRRAQRRALCPYSPMGVWRIWGSSRTWRGPT
ncbi:hypothetical protein HYPSUDRAFT_288829 [Hypholoma sublateritium FD-334 SS-4]|uniref:Uncharacterized protein n=1 Tax=Hypholoma sublateritium (strain FD-334 SS-4) TaxID=945553 RepID=A0A0D2NIY6_HYPSF|nr:hypothetical protein HYPSUDRAFT_288829 [Hypholoma sublateritium FD-334 SS-4]